MTRHQRERTIEAFHRETETVIFEDGSTAPITKWIDGNGADCGPFDYPVTAVAGPDENGRWHTLDLSEFKTERTH